MKKVSLWERYLTKEIGIEFKACLYFFAILFFYCMYRIMHGKVNAEILHMAEMILLTYLIGYLQVFVLWNFDEADRLGKSEWFGILLCTVIYSGISFLCNWFDRNIGTTLTYMCYIIFMYYCVHLVYKWRRDIDDKILNNDLLLFKEGLEKETDLKQETEC